jgi:predicted RNA-binding protein with PUA-like domain
MRYWLMKSEPDEFSIDALARAPRQRAAWIGVRNYQARNFMRDQMQIGDPVLFYHSSCAEPGIAGLAEVCAEAYPDETQFDRKSKYYDAKATRDQPRWVNVTRFVKKRSSSAWPNCASTRSWPRCACSRAATACPLLRSNRANGSSSPPNCSNKT